MKVYTRKSNATVALNKILQKYEEIILQHDIYAVDGGFVIRMEFDGEVPKDCKEIVKQFDSSKTAAENAATLEAEVKGEEPAVEPAAEEPADEEMSDEELAKQMAAADAQANMTEIVEGAPIAESIPDQLIRASSVTRPCKLVWELADAHKGKSRKEIIAMAVAHGVATNTARTQYQAWYSLNKDK